MAKGKVRYGKRGGTYRLVKGKKVYVKHEKKHRKK
jgi:hypothetical protein